MVGFTPPLMFFTAYGDCDLGNGRVSFFDGGGDFIAEGGCKYGDVFAEVSFNYGGNRDDQIRF